MDPLIVNLMDASKEVTEDPNAMFDFFTLIIENGTAEELRNLQTFFLGFNEMIQTRLDTLAE